MSDQNAAEQAVIDAMEVVAVPADQPLPIDVPESAEVAPVHYPIFVSFIVGKDKFRHDIIRTPFEDIDTGEKFIAAVQALEKANDGKRVTILAWKALDG